MIKRICWPLLTGLILSGCAPYYRNPPLRAAIESASGYRFHDLEKGDANSDETFVIVALSGGGTRASALSYGVLSALKETPLPGERRTLLDEVDVISAVSGGSFAAAYYALYGQEKFFRDFRSDVLSHNIERGMLWWCRSSGGKTIERSFGG